MALHFLRIYMKWEVAGINNSSLGHLCIRGTNEAHVKAIILRILFRKRKQRRDNVHQLPERGHPQTTFIIIVCFIQGSGLYSTVPLESSIFWDIAYLKAIILKILFRKRKQRRDNVHQLPERGHLQTTFITICLFYSGFRPVGSLLKAQCFWDIPYVKVIILRILFCKRKQRYDNVNKLQKRGHPQTTFLKIFLIILGSGL